jgi:hypothetical protein
MDDQKSSDIENICGEFVSALQGNVSWKWDDRFETALTECNVSNKDSIRIILERFLTSIWEGSNIDNAPDIVQTIVNKFGGLMPGQLLFTADTKQDDFLYGVWWPWGDGNKISIRVAPSCIKLSTSEYIELIKKFRGWFEI